MTHRGEGEATAENVSTDVTCVRVSLQHTEVRVKLQQTMYLLM